MGGNTPDGYLICDGSVKNISTYSLLADYFLAQFGKKNYFGGDGTSTFAVPDLRGEFLRGTGTNGHANQGSGGTVGSHQDSTVFSSVTGSNGELYLQLSSLGSYQEMKNNFDGDKGPVSGYQWTFYRGEIRTDARWRGVRPTNTSVTYIIKAYYNTITL